MNKSRVVAGLAVAALGMVLGSALADGPKSENIHWHGDIKTAWEASKKSGDPMLVYVTMQNCRFCTKMAQETLIDGRVEDEIQQGYVPVEVHREDAQELVKRLGVKAYPTTLIVLPSGKVYASAKGYVEAERFARSLKSARKTLEDGGEERTARLPR